MYLIAAYYYTMVSFCSHTVACSHNLETKRKKMKPCLKINSNIFTKTRGIIGANTAEGKTH